MTASVVNEVAAVMRAATHGPGILGAASAYHLSTGGQGWRASLTVACGSALSVPRKHSVQLGAACELIHQASIVHDDVQDNAATRRNQPCVAARFSAPVAICVGDHLLARGFGLLASLPNVAGLTTVFADRITEMAAAQAEELNPMMWDGMTHARYAAIASGKVGAMVALCVESVARLAGLSGMSLASACRSVRLVGIAYQAGDDLDDLASDLRRGALNGVIALALDTRDRNERERLLQLLRRARHDGLGSDEASACAERLSTSAAQLSEWAYKLLREAEDAVAGQCLEPVITATAHDLAARMLGQPVVKECAA